MIGMKGEGGSILKRNLRNLLYNLKCKQSDEFRASDQNIKDSVYDAVKENIDFFANNHMNIYDMYFTIPICFFREKGCLDRFIEIQEKFNAAATGVFGLKYDNQTHMVFSDNYTLGNKFSICCYPQKTQNGTKYEVYVYDITGTRQLCEFATESPTLTSDEYNLLKNCQSVLEQQYADERKHEENVQLVNKYYREYIRVENKKNEYAHFTCTVYIRKDIPVNIPIDDIVKIVVGWECSFGGKITQLTPTETEYVYHAKIYTD